LATMEVAPIAECEAHCRDGSGIACAAAAHKYCRGLGIHRDVARCLPLALRACELNVAAGCDDAAYVYTGTAGPPRDDPAEQRMLRRALELWQRDCDADDGMAC